MTKSILFTLTAVVLSAAPAAAQHVLPGPNGPTVVLGSPYYPPPGPIVTPNIVTGVNPQTGGLDTSNTQINPSAFDPNRFSSQFNGTKRWVQRPVHNEFGQVVGYQQGYVWNNSITGQEHGKLQSFTPNGLGGVNQQGGVHRQTNHYSRRPTAKPSVGPRPTGKTWRPRHAPHSLRGWQRSRPVR